MAEELLDQVIQLLEEPLAGVELRRAWGPGWASRLLEGPVASGEVLSHHREGDRQETVLRFSLFAPEAQERREAAAALEAAVAQLCPGCVEIDRGQPDPSALFVPAAGFCRRRFGHGCEAGRQKL